MYGYLKQIELKLNQKSLINLYNSEKIEKIVDKKPYCQKEIQVYFFKKEQATCQAILNQGIKKPMKILRWIQVSTS